MYKINFNNVPCIYWSDATKISYLQRHIIVYSIMYYELNESCISDNDFDSIAHQLVELQRSVDQKEFKKSKYYYCMHDFDGNTGFDILRKLTGSDRDYLTEIAETVLKEWRKIRNDKIKRNNK